MKYSILFKGEKSITMEAQTFLDLINAIFAAPVDDLMQNEALANFRLSLERAAINNKLVLPDECGDIPANFNFDNNALQTIAYDVLCDLFALNGLNWQFTLAENSSETEN